MTGRVIAEHKTNFIVSIDGTEYTGSVRGSFHDEDTQNMFPKVGDIVECEKISDDQVVIESILPRKTEIARKDADGTSRQVMVANVDVIFVVMGLDADFNLRRLERYLTLAEQSHVQAVVVLNKSDRVSEPDEYVLQVRHVAPDVAVHAVSALTSKGMDELMRYISAETVVVLLGSSGAGKSTITNWFLDEARQSTGKVRTDDSRGRHTTTGRQMFKLPLGGFLIDTPGIRELAVFSEDDVDTAVFADIEVMKGQCQYSDCDHEKSDGCAIQRALADGRLDEKRYSSYLKLQREREYLRAKVDEGAAHERKQRVRRLRTSHSKIIKKKSAERDER